MCLYLFTWTFWSCETKFAIVERDFLKLESLWPSREDTNLETAIVDCVCVCVGGGGVSKYKYSQIQHHYYITVCV